MDELVAQGQPVRLVNRSGKVNETLPPNVELVNGDASDATFTTEAAQGASVVYFALNPPYDKWAELFPPLQAAVIEAAAKNNAKLVVMDNLYMYGHTNGIPMTEATPAKPTSKKGKVRAQMAADMQAAHHSGRVRVAVGRAADFFGPRVLESSLGYRVMDGTIAGKAAQFIGNPDLPHTYTYMPDIGKALVRMGQDDAALGQVWHIPSPETRTTRDIITQIYAVTGHEMKLAIPPKLGVQFLGLFNPVVREVVEMLYQFEAPFHMDSSRFEEKFGQTATDWDTAIAQTVAWYQANRS